MLVANKDEFELDLSDTNMSGEAILKFSDILTSKPCNSSCKCELDLSENPFGIDGLFAIFKVVSNESGSITKLRIREVNFTTLVYSESPIQSTDSVVNDLGLVQFSSGSILKHLDFSDSHLGEAGVNSLETIVKTGSLINLERLNLSHTLLDNSDINGKLLTTLLPSIATHCLYLKDLDLSENNLGVPGSCAVGEVLSLLVSNRDEFELNLTDTNMSGEAAVKFSDILTSRPYDSSCKCELDLSKNQFGIDGLSAIFKIFSINSFPVAELTIRWTDFTSPESLFCNTQCTDKTVDNLDLVQFLSSNTLNYLCMHRSHLGESGVKSLETTIRTRILVNLERLELSHSLTDNADVNGKLLTTLLPSIATHCPNIKDLDLSENNLGIPGACAVGEAFSLLVSSKDKFELDLSDSNMSCEAAVKFSDILTSSPCDSLCKCTLNLSENSFGIDGLSAILKVFSNKSCPVAELTIRWTDFTSPESLYCNIQCTEEIVSNLDSVQFSSSNILQDLSLWRSHLGESGVKSLEATIRTRILVNLETLDLSHTLTDSADVNGKLLTTLLPSLATHCPHLEDLDLSINNLGVPGACAVAEAFSLLVSSKDEFKLNLSDTNMSGEAAIKFSDILMSRPCDSLCKCELDLSENQFGIEGLSAILKIISSKLCLVSKLKIREADLTTPVTPNSPYCNIDCTKETANNLGCTDLLQFSPRNILKYLDFSDSLIGNLSVKPLESTVRRGGLINLERLDLSHTLIDSANVNGKLLTTLLPSIANHCHQLKKMNLSKNNLGEPGTCAVAEAFSLLVSNKDEFELNLSDTNMNGEAAVKFSDILTSKPCDSLCKCKLDLSKNQFGIDGLSAVFKIFLIKSCQIARLDIFQVKFNSESLCYNIQHTDEMAFNLGSRDLVQFNTLKYVDLRGSQLGELSVKSLNMIIQRGGLVNIETLDLSHTLIDSADVNGKLLTTLLPSIATHCRQLKKFNLSNNNLSVPGACAVGEALSLIISNKQKFDLNLSDTNMCVEAAIKFSDILTSRTCDCWCECSLDLSENAFGIKGLSAICKIISSRTFPIARLTIRDAKFNLLESLYCNMQHTDETARNSGCKDLVQFLPRSTLKYLDFSDSHIREPSVKALETTIQTGCLVNLETLDLSHTLIDSADVNGKLLTTLLPSIATHCPHLEDLDLSNNNLGVPGACAVAEAFSLLVSNKDEFELNLSDTNMSSAAAVKLSDILTSRPCDSSCECELDLGKNQFGIGGLSAIFKMVSSKSCPVAKLTIGQSDFTILDSTFQHLNTTVSNLGCDYLVEFLFSTYLKHLDLSDSHIGESVVKSLNTTIQTGGLVNLERLNLSHTLIDSTDVSGKLLTTLLPSIATHCPHLEDLDLSNNNLGVPGACAVGEAFSLLVSNKDEFELDLSNTNMSGEAAVKFSDILTSRTCNSLCKCALDLSNNRFGMDGLSTIFNIFLFKTCGIAKLKIGKANFNSQVEAKSSCPNVQHTDEMACNLSCMHLVQFNVLKYVDLRRSQLGEPSVNSLNAIIQRGGLVNIERLDLSHTLIDSANVNGKLLTTLLPSIANHCHQLKKMNLSKNNLGEPGTCAVAEAFSLLVSNKDEFELNLSDTNMNGEAAVKFSDILTSKPCDSLCKCKLDLSKNQFGIDGLSAVFKIFLIKSCQIARLDIFQVKFNSESLCYNIQHTDEMAFNLGSRDLVQFNTLKYVDLRGSQLGELSVKSLNMIIQRGGLVNIETLDLSHTLIDSADVNGKLLTTLLPSIATHCRQLKKFNLSNNNLSVPGACAVGEALSLIISNKQKFDLNLSDTNMCVEAAIKFSDILTSRTCDCWCECSLDLSENAFGIKGLSAICKIISSRTFPIARLTIRDAKFNLLESLYCNMQHTDETARNSGCKDLVQFLPRSTLKYLDFSDSHIREPSVKALETTIQTGCLVNLETLDLSHTLIDSADVNGKLLTTLLPSIATHCPHLEDLDLSNNNLGVPGACAVAEAFSLLVSNKDEFELNLSDTNMSSAAAVKLSDILTSRPCDSSCECELDLGKNQFGIGGLSAIFKMVSSKSCPVAKLTIGQSDFTILDSTFQHLNTTVSNLGCDYLVEFLFSTYLKHLDLSDSHIGESVVKSLNTTIQTSGLVNLERLNLSHTLIDSTDVSGKLLTTLLPSIATHCPHLEDLDLSNNNLGVPGACAVGEAFSLLVSNKDEFELDLSNTNMSGEAAVKFSDILTSRTCNSLCKCALDLSNNRFGMDGLSTIFNIFLFKTCGIAKLKIGKANFNSQVEAKSSCPNVQHTDEMACNLSCMHLVQFNVLKYVDLRRSQLGEPSVNSLNAIIQRGGLVNIERLDLSHTLVDSADVNGKLLTTLLPSIATHCPHLEDLNLSNNNLGVPGACAVAEAFSLLVSNKNEFELNLCDTNMNGEAAIKFSDILTSKPCDSLCKCELDLSENLLGIDGLSAIFELFLIKSSQISMLGIRKADFRSQINFKSSNHNIQDMEKMACNGCRDLVQLNVLKYVDLRGSQLGELSVKSLNTIIQRGGLVNIERLDLSHTLIDSADVNGKLLTTLLPSIATHCSNLKDLDLSNNNLGVPGACAVGETLSLLVSNKDEFELDLSDTNMCGKAAVKFSDILRSRPCDCSCECTLDLSENAFGINGLSAICKIVSSKTFPIAKLIIRDAKFNLRESLYCNMQYTNEPDRNVGCKDLVEFSSCNILKYLDFSDSHIREPSVKALETTIETGCLVHLERLDLSHTLIDSADVNGKLLTTLLPSIATHCPHLEDLDLSNNNLGVPGAYVVAEAFSLLVSNKDEFELNLSDTNMSGEAAVKLSDILTSRPCDSSCKCELNLGKNQFGIEGLSAILGIFLIKSCPIARLEIRNTDFASSVNPFSIIQHCNTTVSSLNCEDSTCNNIMKYLDFCDSRFGESGVKSLEFAIQTGCFVSLERLDLSHTLIDNADVNGKLLTTLLPSIATHCPHLKDLDLSNNNLGVPGACAVAEAVSSFVSNREEFNLDLSETNMSGEAAVKFSAIVTSRSCNCLCNCKLNFSENLIGIYCLSIISNPVTELNLCQTGYVSKVNTKTHHFVNEYTYSASCFLYNENNMLTKLNLYKTNCSGSGILMLAECIRMCKSLEDLSCRKCSLTSSDIIELLSHFESNRISHKNLSSWDLRDNFIDNKGVAALIKSIPDIVPHLENVRIDGNLVSDEVKKKLKNLLKVIIACCSCLQLLLFFLFFFIKPFHLNESLHCLRRLHTRFIYKIE